MLSHDVIKVIDQIGEKIETNELELLTFEDIKNACFMVMGHIEQLKANNNFTISDHAQKDVQSYKRIILCLVELQAKFIDMNKNKVLGNYIADLNDIRNTIYSIPNLLGLDYKNKTEKIHYYIFNMIIRINKLKYKLLEVNCFDRAQMAHAEFVQEIIFLYSKLLEIHHAAKMRYSVVIKGYFEAMQERFDFYLKEITYFRNLEIINTKCLCYCVMDYLPKNIRH
ncbi:hypothetical protein Lsan_2104 [Legionella santicrucis]|uniref:Uncharacterized protein n=1 Tax=Legionella santicrucis TaxID=45074 RepID=A0A0W0YUV6_9GAMM|nr:hypothetical protein [Legionella santicrucis]KTD60326.1 hypothetical protein Lsan_2104 [Legionella santicrucis]